MILIPRITIVTHPIGIGSRRTDSFLEKQKIFTSTVTVFRADQLLRARYSSSVGFGSSAANPNNEDERAATTVSRPPSVPRGRSERRSVVRSYPRTPTDGNLERHTHHVPPDLGPTPPYTPVAQSPAHVQSRLGASGEHPAQTLEDLRQALRDDLEGQAYSNGFSEQFRWFRILSIDVSRLQFHHLRVRPQSHSHFPIPGRTPPHPAHPMTLFTDKMTWCIQALCLKATHHLARLPRSPHTFCTTLAPHRAVPLLRILPKAPMNLSPPHAGLAVTLRTHQPVVPVYVFHSLPS